MGGIKVFYRQTKMMNRMNLNNQALRRILFLSPLLTMAKAATFSTINKNSFDYGEFVIPHPSKVHKGGEDAWYADSNF